MNFKKPLKFFCTCICMLVCVCVCVDKCAHKCVDPEFTITVFLHYSQSFGLTWFTILFVLFDWFMEDFPQNMEFTNLTNFSCKLNLGHPCVCLSSLGIIAASTSMHSYTYSGVPNSYPHPHAFCYKCFIHWGISSAQN